LHYRQLILCGDGSYTNGNVLKHLPERTTYIGRIRKDAKLYWPLEQTGEKAKGRPRRYGAWRRRRNKFCMTHRFSG